MPSPPLPALVDTHTHLTDARFDTDRDAVLERARAVGVDAIVVVSETLVESHAALALAAAHPGVVHAAAGLFPTVLDPPQAEAIETLIRARRGDLVAIGEVGLDYWIVKEEAEREVQRDILGRFARLSIELDLPLNVHSRSAGHHAIRFLLEAGATRVQMHAFDGKASKAAPAVEAGYFFSVPPSIVRSIQKQKLVKRVPLENLLLETDSPVLGPDRDARNEPANVRVSLDAIAELKCLAVEEVAETMLENTCRLYGEALSRHLRDTAP